MTPKLIISDGRSQREMLLVGDLVVGRDPVCDISGDDALLSRRHAQFVVGGSDIRVRDLGSRNGIYVNGRKVAEAKLAPGDVLAIGHFQIQFVEDATPLASVVAKVAPVVPVAPVTPVAPVAAVETDDDDLTRHVGPPRPGAPRSTPTTADTDDDNDSTRLVAPPSKPSAPPASKPAVPPQAAPRAPAAAVDHDDFTRAVPPPQASPRLSSPSLAPPPKPAGYEDHDETRFVPGPVTSIGTPRLGSFESPALERAPAYAPAKPPVSVATAQAVSPQAKSAAAAPEGASAGSVYGYVAGLAIVVAAAVATPFVMGAASGPMAVAWFGGSAVVIVVAVVAVGASIGRRMRG